MPQAGNNISLQITQHGFQQPFDQFANMILLNNALKENNINQVATQILANNPIGKHFMTPSFDFRSDFLKFSIIQKDKFEDLLCNKIIKIGFNYQCKVNISDINIDNVNGLFDKKINVKDAPLSNFETTLHYNSNILNCAIDITINKKDNELLINFNADNKILETDNFGNILDKDFLSEFKRFYTTLILS